MGSVELRRLRVTPHRLVPTIATGSGPRILHLSDLHIGKNGPGDLLNYLDLWLDVALEHAVDGIALTGDLCHVPDDTAALAAVRSRLDATGIDWFVVPGNHDVQTPGDTRAFESSFPGPWPSVRMLGDVAVVALDSFGRFPIDERTSAEQADHRQNGHWTHGRIGLEQLTEAATLLRRAQFRSAIVLLHHYLFEDENRADPLLPLADRDELLAWCADHQIAAVLYGHRHDWTDARVVDGTLFALGSRVTRAPFQARILTLGDPPEIVELALAGPH